MLGSLRQAQRRQLAAHVVCALCDTPALSKHSSVPVRQMNQLHPCKIQPCLANVRHLPVAGACNCIRCLQGSFWEHQSISRGVWLLGKGAATHAKVDAHIRSGAIVALTRHQCKPVGNHAISRQRIDGVGKCIKNVEAVPRYYTTG